jgi:hypothetical protein
MVVVVVVVKIMLVAVLHLQLNLVYTSPPAHSKEAVLINVNQSDMTQIMQRYGLKLP